MRETHNRKLFRLCSGFCIWAPMVLLWGFIWYTCFSSTIELPFYRRGNWVVIGIYGFLLFFVMHFYGGYRVGYARRGDLIFSGILSTVIINFLSFFQVLAIARMLPSRQNVLPFVWMTGIDIVLVWVWATLAGKLYLRWNPPRHLLLVYGSSSMAQSLIPKIAEREDKYIIQEAINIEDGLHRVLDRVDAFSAVLICDVKSSYRNRILKHCYHKGIRVYMTPKISDILIRGASEISLFDSPLLLSRNEGLTSEQRFVKRTLDILLCGIGIIFAAPVMLLIALAIKLEDDGPVFYSQVRLTQGGKEFRLHKFRSMIVDAEKDTGARLAARTDDRITSVGRVIRRIRFDELPQLINIIKGEMSLVGPRPERPEIAEEYRASMTEFDFRLKVKAGLTGYAQVVGKYNTTPYDKLKLDLTYISNYSLQLDIKLILQTVKILFMKSSTEGIS